MDKHVNVVEIGPRDGFQSISCMMIPTEVKLEIIEAILAAGVKTLQCTSFVSPKAIPQMQDAAKIVAYMLEKHPDIETFALVPNFQGAKLAAEAGLKKVAPVISLSASHNMNNVRRTHQESFDELKRIMDTFPQLELDLDVATAFGCPFEGRMTTSALVDFVGKLHDMGIRQFNICDTIGVAYPTQVREAFGALLAAYPDAKFSAHIHDTRNMGILNSLEAVRCGIDTIQTTLGGLEMVDAQLQAGQRVGQRHAAGVVQMHHELVGAELVSQRFHDMIGVGGVGNTHSVGHGDHAAPQLQAEAGHVHHSFRADLLTGKGAAQRGDQTQAEVDLVLILLDQLAELFHRLGRRAADIGHVVLLADADDIGDLVHAALHCSFHAPGVGDQRNGPDAVFAQVVLYRHKHFLGVCHLRDGFGADKGDGLDSLESCLSHLADDSYFAVKGDKIVYVLNAVARADLRDLNVLREYHVYAPSVFAENVQK